METREGLCPKCGEYLWPNLLESHKHMFLMEFVFECVCGFRCSQFSELHFSHFADENGELIV